MNSFQVGTAERQITPRLGCPLAGYFEAHFAEEIVNDLFAKVLAVRSRDGTTVVLTGCDLLALAEDTVASVRNRIQLETGIPASNVMLFALHNHTGPLTVSIFGGEPDREYLDTIEREIVKGVVEAARSLEPAELCFASGREERLSCNRRLIMKDGSVHTHITDADLPDIVGREGPVDHEVGVLVAGLREGGPRALAVNFGLHPTNVRGNRVCSDYAGYLAEHLRAVLGNDLGVLFANGACGNIDSKTEYLAGVDYGPGRARRIGHDLAGAILNALPTAEPITGDEIVAASEIVPIPLKEIPPDRLELARRILEREGDPEELVLTRGTRRPSLLKERVYAAEMIALAEQRKESPTVSAEIQVIRIGDLAIVGVPVELFVELGLDIKRIARERFRHCFVIELANGYLGYVPTRKSFEGGGYETRAARSSQLAPEAGEMLVDAAARLLNKV